MYAEDGNCRQSTATYHAVHPPSTVSVWQFTMHASSLDKKATASATSSGKANFPADILRSTKLCPVCFSHVDGVSNKDDISVGRRKSWLR
jgi:hypothetical protein